MSVMANEADLSYFWEIYKNEVSSLEIVYYTT